jgi:hypothetical protein
MAEVRFRRPDFPPYHSVASVELLEHELWVDGPGEARPTAPGLKLVERTEKWLACHHIDIEAGFMVVPIGVLEGWFGPTFLSHVVLQGVEFADGVVHDLKDCNF